MSKALINTVAIITEYGASQEDTGSIEVQCALLTAHIHNLTEHLKVYKKDFQTRNGLIRMVTQRKKLLKKLREYSVERYETFMKKIKLIKS